MEKKAIHTPRGTVFYWRSEVKREQAIMFSHGLTADHTLFDKQIAFWSREYTVITWDMPLHGESRPYQDFTFSHLADDMKQILDEEQIGQAVMAGQSGGGYAVQAFALKYPARLGAFLAIGSSPFGKKYYKKSELFVTRHFSAIARLYPYNYYCKAAAKATCRTPEARDSFHDCLKKLGKQGMLTAATAVYRDFPHYEEVNFTCPVILFVGEYDQTGYVRRYNEMWSKETGYPLLIVPNAAHNANYDNAPFFNQKAYDMLHC